MHGFVQKVRTNIQDHKLCDSSHSIVAAVSGGADSVAMALSLKALQYSLSLAYVDHQAQPDSRGWGDFVEQLAGALECPFYRLSCEPGTGSEADLRDGRYDALETLDCDRIATAHTADDQAETVLMRLIRGAGTAGLSGIPLQRGRFIRPLLSNTRAEVVDYLEHAGQDFIHDPTNDSTDPLRNRVRHVLIPLLKNEFQPKIVSLLTATADSLRGERGALESLARAPLENHQLALGPLLEIHPAIRAHVLRLACPVTISSERFRAIERLITEKGGPVQLEGGVTVETSKTSKKVFFRPTKTGEW